MEIDKRILEEFQHVTMEERDEFMKLFQIMMANHEPEAKIFIGLLRENFMQRQLTSAMLFKFEQNLKSIKNEVEELRTELRKQKTRYEDQLAYVMATKADAKTSSDFIVLDE